MKLAALTVDFRKHSGHTPADVAQWSKVLFSYESKVCMSFGNQEWRGTESTLLEVQCEVSTVSDDLGSHVICWCWSTVFSEVHSQRSHLPGHFRALHAQDSLTLLVCAGDMY